MKVCSKCKKNKPDSEFYYRSDKKYLLQSHCKECIKAKRKKYRLENIERFKEKDRLYNLKNKEKRLKYLREYQNTHKEERNKKGREKLKTDISFKLKTNISNRIRKAIKNGTKRMSTIYLLGCSIEEFKLYFQSKFTNDMNWDLFLNSEIQIDHIIPCSAFDLTKLKERKKCFNFNNLQPLFAADNLKKSNKII